MIRVQTRWYVLSLFILPLDIGKGENDLVQEVFFNIKQNRSPQRKALAFFALCLAFSIVGMQRLMFVSVNAIITAQFSISSTQTAALTGIAFIFSAISNPLWEMLSMKVGKRGILIFASVLMLAGSLWNMRARSFGEFLGGRIFEGLGWGAFEGLIRGAVGDMYYVSLFLSFPFLLFKVVGMMKNTFASEEDINKK